MEDTLNSLLLELEESKLLDTFCLLEGKKGVSHSSFLATVQAIHSQAKYKQPLVVDIDHESLWEQLNIVNRPLIRSFEKSVLRLMKKPMRSEALGEREKASAHPSRKTAQEHLEQEEQDYDEENDLNDEEIASDEVEDENDLDKNQNQNNGDGSVAGESWVEAEANHSVGSEEGGMEAWLDEMEALDEKDQQRVEKELQQARTGERLDDDEEQQDGNDNEDDADLLLGVQSALYDSGSDMDSDTDGAAAVGNFKFSDFFKTEKRARKPGRTSAEKNQQATALEEDDEEEEGEEEDEGEEEESGEDAEEVEEEEEGGAVSGRAGGKGRRELLKARQSSSQQQRGAAALRNQIESMESFLLQDKPWELRGEVAAKDRPQDSLLELAADIER